jgi:phosphohistidine phosphatase
LIFVRHGRAEDTDSEFSDFERSLTQKGKIISRQMARKLIEQEKVPDIVITSPAFRAIETAFIFAEEFKFPYEKIITDSNLYYRMNSGYLTDILSHTSNDVDVIMLFGHNPSFTEIPAKLSKGGSDFVPKSGIICISFNINKWSEINQNTGKTEYFLKPEKAL